MIPGQLSLFALPRQGVAEVWTDGSCWPNPDGAGGWAFVTDSGLEVTGGELKTTNNRMEVRPIIEAVKHVQDRPLVVYSDSQYAVQCGMGKWKRKKNKDLWVELDKYMDGVTLKWVRGHNGNVQNERAHVLAEIARMGVENE